MLPKLPLSFLASTISLCIAKAASISPGTPCIGQTAAVSRSAGYIDIFYSSTDGRVYTASKGPNDNTFSKAIVIGSIQTAYCSDVAAISAAQGEIDIFVTGADSFVYTSSLNKNDGTYSAWTQFAGATAKPGTLVTPVSATKGVVEVFWVGKDGIVRVAELRSSNTTAVDQTTASIGAGNHVAAVPRFNNPSTVDMILTGSDSNIYHEAFETSDKTGKWTNIGFAGSDKNHMGAVGSPITAIMLSNGDLRLFSVGQDYLVYTAVRAQSAASSFSAWSQVGDLLVPVAAPIYGVTTGSNTIQLFVTANDGLIYTSTWNGGPGPWNPISGVYSNEGAPVSGVSTSDTTVKLFVTSLDKNISTIDWSVNQSPSCPWWTVGTAPLGCSAKTEAAPGASSASSSTSKGGASGKYIGMGVAIGLLIGGLAIAGLFFFLKKRYERILKEQSSQSMFFEQRQQHPAEIFCQPAELASTGTLDKKDSQHSS